MPIPNGEIEIFHQAEYSQQFVIAFGDEALVPFALLIYLQDRCLNTVP